MKLENLLSKVTNPCKGKTPKGATRKKTAELFKVIYAKRLSNGAYITVFNDGIVLYEKECNSCCINLNKPFLYRDAFCDYKNRYINSNCIPIGEYRSFDFDSLIKVVGEEHLEINKYDKENRITSIEVIQKQLDSDMDRVECTSFNGFISLDYLSPEDAIIKWCNDIEEEARKIKLYKAMDLLTERQKQIIYMHFWREMSITQISKELKITHQSVNDSLHSSYKKIRKML